MTATTAPLPFPCFQAAGIPIWRRCHWYLKQVSLGKLFPSAPSPALAPHSASIDPVLAASAVTSCSSSSAGMLASAS